MAPAADDARIAENRSSSTASKLWKMISCRECAGSTPVHLSKPLRSTAVRHVFMGVIGGGMRTKSRWPLSSGRGLLQKRRYRRRPRARHIEPPVSMAPEPATWLMMMSVGFGAIGAMLRRRRLMERDGRLLHGR
ncbi:PEP-CTERM sorting domain-containing protein [Sphingomonas sp. C8-2]|nr:PEP-CTERM sorting domain-containing protein [Sphingomonas sp. C8-2]